MEERGDRKTTVSLYGRSILPSKVKKEISRHTQLTWALSNLKNGTGKITLVHTNLNFSDCKIDPTQSQPVGLVISTPPRCSLDSLSPGPSNAVTYNKRLRQEPSWENLPSPKRQCAIVSQMYIWSVQEMALSDHERQGGLPEAGTINIKERIRQNLKNSPYMRFRDFMRSPGI